MTVLPPGVAFLMRNYRADHGKWLTADPMGYPDGWNQMAYCGNDIVGFVDVLGAWAAGRNYSIVDNGVPWYVGSTRTQDNDMWWANKSDNYFSLSGAPLSQALVAYAQSSTGTTAADYTVELKYMLMMELDPGFASVRNKVSELMRGLGPGQSFSFNDVVADSTLTSHDLTTAIHGVHFHLDGTMSTDDTGRWSGYLRVSFHDLYDFKADDPDWRVRVWGRLWTNGWISRFNAIGTWYVRSEE